MAKRAVKTYQVRFETQGFKDVAEALQQIQERIRNSTAEALKVQARRQDLSVQRSQAARERDRDIFGGKFVRQGEGSPYSRQSILTGIQEGLGFKPESAKKEGLTFGSAFLIGVADALEVKSPSRAMFRIGQQAALGFREGFESIPDQFRSINKGINTKLQPRDASGQFTESRNLSFSGQKFTIELQRLNRSLERINTPLQQMAGNIGKFVEDVRPKSQEELLSRQFDTDISTISASNKGLAQAFRTALREQTLELSKAIEDSGGRDSPFTPLGIASGIVGSITKPFEAIIFGALDEIGSSLTTDFGAGLSKKLAKSSGLDPGGMGEDLGQIIGVGIKDTIEETLSVMRKAIEDESGDTGKYAGEVFSTVLQNTLKTLTRTPLIGTRAISRMAAQTQAIPQVKQQLGNMLANQQISAEEAAKINESNSITIVVGGVNMDPDATSTDYTHAMLEHGIEGSHVVPMRNLWSNQETSPEFQKTYGALLKKVFRNPEILAQVRKHISSTDYKGEMDPFAGITEADLEDIDTFAEKMASVQQPFSKVLESFLHGYNPDDVKIAAQIAYYRQKFPDKPINVVGTSFGGFNAAGAKNLVDMMGIPDVRGAGITTPFQGFGVQPNEDEFLGSIGKEDPLYQMVNGVLGGVLPKPLFHQVVDKPKAGTGHLLGTYITSDRTQDFRDAFNQMFAGRGQLSPSLSSRDIGLAGRATKNNEFARAILQMFGEPVDSDRYAFKPDDLRYFIQEQKAKIKKASSPEVKEREEQIVKVLEQLVVDLENFYKTREVGLDYKPVGTLQQMAEFIPSLEEVAKKYEGKDFTDQNVANVRAAESRPEVQLKRKLREEGWGIGRTLERMGMVMPGSPSEPLPFDDTTQGWSFYHPNEPVRVEYLQGLMDHLQTIAPSAESQEYLAPYLKFLQNLKGELQRRHETPEPSYENDLSPFQVKPELLQEYQSLFGKGAEIEKPVPVKGLKDLSKQELKKIEAERQRQAEERARQSAPPPLATAPDPTARFREMQARAREHGRVDPYPGRVHFANSRSTSRRFFMMRRAAVICASKPGS